MPEWLLRWFLCSANRWNTGLNDAIANDPKGHEAADLVKIPTKGAGEENRHANYEPYIPAGKQEDPCGRQVIHIS